MKKIINDITAADLQQIISAISKQIYSDEEARDASIVIARECKLGRIQTDEHMNAPMLYKDAQDYQNKINRLAKLQTKLKRIKIN